MTSRRFRSALQYFCTLQYSCTLVVLSVDPNMALRSILFCCSFMVSVRKITALEFYTRNTIHVKPESVLEVKEVWGEVECLLGCKNYKGCVTSSFKKHRDEDAKGNCTFYSAYRTDSTSGNITTVGYVFMGNL